MPHHTPSVLLWIATSGSLILGACNDGTEDSPPDWEVIGEHPDWFTAPLLHDGVPVVLSSEGVHDLSSPGAAPVPVEGLKEHSNPIIHSVGSDRLYVYSALYPSGPLMLGASSLIDTSTSPATVLWTSEVEGSFLGVIGGDLLYSRDGAGLVLLDSETGEEDVFGEGFYQFSYCTTTAAGACCVGEEPQSEVLVIAPDTIETRQTSTDALTCALHPSGELSVLGRDTEAENVLTAIRQAPSDEIIWTETFTSQDGGWSAGESATSSGDSVLFALSDGFTWTVEVTPSGAELFDGFHLFIGDGYRLNWDTGRGDLVFTSPQGETTRADMLGSYLPSMLKHEDRVYGRFVSSHQDGSFCGLLCAIVNNQKFGSVITSSTSETANVYSTFTLP